MKVSYSWLAEWVPVPWSPRELGSRLTMAGFELEALEAAAPEFSGVIVAEIVSAERHPQADKLQVCRVSTGQGEPLQIVCGASNARAGLKTALATVGAKLPGDLNIKAAKLRGVESFGMLASAKELGLAETSAGILELPADAPVGAPLREYLALDDTTLELNVTPNRGDAMSVLGVAREVAALTWAVSNAAPASVGMRNATALNATHASARAASGAMPNATTANAATASPKAANAAGGSAPTTSAAPSRPGPAGAGQDGAMPVASALTSPQIERLSPRLADTFPVHLDAPAACPRFVGCVIRGVDNKRATPMWMRERLRRAGVRSISPVVDVTNYVMLELGQPMHAYDLAKLRGEIRVRLARAGEPITLLDGKTIEAQADVLLITDRDGPVGLAGIMGGERTAVSADTTDVFFELAYFAPDAIIGRSRRWGLVTDASQRFERGVDPTGQERAAERAVALLRSIAGGECGSLQVEQSAGHLPRRSPVALRQVQLERLLGLKLPPEHVLGALEALQMQVRLTPEGWEVTPPAHRFDIAIEADLIEEVARIVGYDTIAEVDALGPQRFHSLPEEQPSERVVLEALAMRGYEEAITFAFVDPALQTRLFPDRPGLALSNPIASDLSVMRVSLWPGLLRAALENQRRQQDRIRLFEHGTRFVADAHTAGGGPPAGGPNSASAARSAAAGTTASNSSAASSSAPSSSGVGATSGATREIDTLAAVACGPRMPEQWGLPKEARGPTDFYDVKGDLEALLVATGARDAFVFEAATLPCLHPGRAARVLRRVAGAGDGTGAGEHASGATTAQAGVTAAKAGANSLVGGAAAAHGTGAYEQVGWIGELHPSLVKELDFTYPPVLLELDFAALAVQKPLHREISRFPQVRRDLAVVVDESVTLSALAERVVLSASSLLQNLRIFDVYRGPGVETGRKSVALGLIFQDISRTLTDDDVERLIASVVADLRESLNAKIRE